MKLDYRQRLLATTLLVGASMVATPAFAQEYPVPETVDPDGTTQPADTSAVPTQPETIAPVEGTAIPTTSAQGEPVRRAQDIIVTGSRIPQPNLESASPVTVITNQEVKLSGTSRTEDLINALPQQFATQGSNVSNGASGTATLNLRGLGQARSLVLVNGKRLHAGSPLSPYPDLNFIPNALIKRVDVLTGGASSVYGADAVAGVANFILDTSFTGFRIDGQASVFNHYNDGASDIIEANEASGFLLPRGWSTNGGAQDIAGVIGAAFDDGRGHVTAYATYRSQDPVLESTRDYSFCALTGLTETAAATAGRNFNCVGSATSASGSFFQYDPAFTPEGALIPGAFTDYYFVSGNEFVTGFETFNFNPYNYFQRPDERFNLGAFADYEITPAFKPYLEVMYMDDRSDAQIAPSGAFFVTNTIACDNALLSESQRERMCVGGPFGPNSTFLGPLNGMADVEQAFVYLGRRNVEGDPRSDNLQHTSWRIAAGMRGDAARGISYDAYYQRGRTNYSEVYRNDISITRLGRALDAVAVLDGEVVAPGTPGATIMCRATFTGLDAACVPWNIFQEGGVTQEAVNYLQTPGHQSGRLDQTIAHIDFTILGDEYGWRMPWAETGLGINVGAEYRKEFLQRLSDTAFETGDLAGQGGASPSIEGQFDVRELFAEIQIPIVQNNFIDEFLINAGYRFSNYNVAGNSFNTDTYKIEAELAPIPDIRFRGSYNRAVRAPNLVELFFPPTVLLGGTSDPCAGAAPAATLAQCQLTGVTAAQYGNVSPNPANQYNALFAGDPTLQPESADTYTLGVVLQPRFIPGLAITADYWNIKIKNLISFPTYPGIFNACFEGDAEACAQFNRAPGTGSLWLGNQGYIVLQGQNFEGTGLKTSGLDFQGNYSRRLGGLGTVNVAFVGTRLITLGTPADDRPGTFSQTLPSPIWRHNLRVGLTMPNGLGVSARWRHFSGVNCEPEEGDPGCASAAGVPIPGNLRISAQDYFDLTFTARLAQRLNLRVGANNVLDRDPPVVGGQVLAPVWGNGNTYPQVYDALGRYLFAGFTVDF